MVESKWSSVTHSACQQLFVAQQFNVKIITVLHIFQEIKLRKTENIFQSQYCNLAYPDNQCCTNNKALNLLNIVYIALLQGLDRCWLALSTQTEKVF